MDVNIFLSKAVAGERIKINVKIKLASNPDFPTGKIYDKGLNFETLYIFYFFLNSPEVSFFPQFFMKQFVSGSHASFLFRNTLLEQSFIFCVAGCLTSFFVFIKRVAILLPQLVYSNSLLVIYF